MHNDNTALFLLGAILFVALIVLYVLLAMRDAIVRVWTGGSPPEHTAGNNGAEFWKPYPGYDGTEDPTERRR